MNKNIYPIDFDQDIECVLAPNLRFKGLMPRLIPVENIIGLDLIQPCNELKPIMIYPTPIVIENNNLFTLVQTDEYWKPDLVNAEGSHLLCMMLTDDLSEKNKQQIFSVVNLIHGNRTVMPRSELYKMVEKSHFVRDNIEDAYNIEGDIFSHKSGLSSLLINNAYKKAPQKRRPTAKVVWNTFASLNKGVMTFNQIIKATRKNPKAVKKRLDELISEDKNLHHVWKEISAGLANNVAKGVPHE